jgi:hypothetical protein
MVCIVQYEPEKHNFCCSKIAFYGAKVSKFYLGVFLLIRQLDGWGVWRQLAGLFLHLLRLLKWVGRGQVMSRCAYGLQGDVSSWLRQEEVMSLQ